MSGFGSRYYICGWCQTEYGLITSLKQFLWIAVAWRLFLLTEEVATQWEVICKFSLCHGNPTKIFRGACSFL